MIVDAQQYFDNQLLEARNEVNSSGKVERIAAILPGIMEFRFGQYQEIEAILEHLNIKLRKIRGERFRFYLEKYNREMTTRDAEKYADADKEVLEFSELINFFALTRNRYMGIMKGLENKAFQINNIVKLRVAGMEDAEVDFIKIPKS